MTQKPTTLIIAGVTMRVIRVAVAAGDCHTGDKAVSCALINAKYDAQAAGDGSSFYCDKLCPGRHAIFIREDEIPAYVAWRLIYGLPDEQAQANPD